MKLSLRRTLVLLVLYSAIKPQRSTEKMRTRSKHSLRLSKHLWFSVAKFEQSSERWSEWHNSRCHEKL